MGGYPAAVISYQSAQCLIKKIADQGYVVTEIISDQDIPKHIPSDFLEKSKEYIHKNNYALWGFMEQKNNIFAIFKSNDNHPCKDGCVVSVFPIVSSKENIRQSLEIINMIKTIME